MGKQNLYEHSIRVPGIIVGPGFEPGKRITELTYLFDLFATICKLARVKPPENIESLSLLPLIRGNSVIRNSIFAAYKDLMRMVTDGRYKLIRYYKSAKTGLGVQRMQFFDLTTDRWETTDRAIDKRYESHLTRLQTLLERWQERVNDPLIRHQ